MDTVGDILGGRGMIERKAGFCSVSRAGFGGWRNHNGSQLLRRERVTFVIWYRRGGGMVVLSLPPSSFPFSFVRHFLVAYIPSSSSTFLPT